MPRPLQSNDIVFSVMPLPLGFIRLLSRGLGKARPFSAHEKRPARVRSLFLSVLSVLPVEEAFADVRAHFFFAGLHDAPSREEARRLFFREGEDAEELHLAVDG